MDTLAVLVVQAIEAVDERRQRRQHGRDVVVHRGIAPPEKGWVAGLT
jgi:hypothetical protein